MTSLTRVFLALSALALLSACSVDAQITDVTRRNLVPRLAESTGLISGSQQNITTPEGYRVSSSVGAPFSGKVGTTNSDGYTIHSNVQGNINSETFDMIVE